MQTFIRALPFVAIVALAGCAENQATMTTSQPTIVSSLPAQPPLAAPSAPSVATTTGMLNTDIAAYVDPSVLSLMSAKERSDASSAQFYALQFGRPGAPRSWGGAGSKGAVVVGPYVRVNNLDCRDFTHTVTVAGKDYVHKGTACREGSGNWTVAAGAA